MVIAGQESSKTTSFPEVPAQKLLVLVVVAVVVVVVVVVANVFV